MAEIIPSSFGTFGEAIRYLRERAHLSQRELAARVGYHYSYISRLEKNKHTLEHTVLLARFVPALGLENESPWVERLVELRIPGGVEDTTVRMDARPIVSEEKAYFLPPSLTSMIGRDHELRLLAKLLLRPEVRLLTVIGPPGVGKTRLALDVAERTSHHFSNGAIFVNLMDVNDPEMVLHVLADALGILETSVAPGLRILKSFLEDKNLLIVMDNFEQILDAAAQLTELLAVAPATKILVTSREALRVQGEREFPLSPLEIPSKVQFDQLGILENMPSVQLFVQRAADVKPDFHLTDQNASLVAEICFRLDGLPLAIELAAARIQSLSLTEMLAQFDRLFDWLTRGRRDMPIWRQTMLGAIEWSYGLLSEPEKLLLARLSVFSGGWNLKLAESICSDESILKPNQILNLLSQLVDRSLVVCDSSTEMTRYRFLDTIFHFSNSKLQQIGQWEALRDRHLNYFSAWMEELETSLDKASPIQLRTLMDAENNNIRLALEWGLQRKQTDKLALNLISSTGFIWLKQSHFKEGLEWALRYLPMAEKFPRHHMRLLFLAEALSYWRDNVKDGLIFGLQGLQIARSMDDKAGMAAILYYLGDIYRELGDLEPAIQSIEEAISTCREIGDLNRLSLSLISRGVILYRMKELDASKASIEEGLKIAVLENNLWAQSYALRVVADHLRFDGVFLESYRAYERALAVSTEIDDRISTGMELANMSMLANILEDFSAAIYYSKRALDLFQMIGNEYQQPFPMRMLAYALIQNNDLQNARVYCLSSLRGNRAVDHKTGVIASLICLAAIIYTEGNISSARNLLYTVAVEMKINNISLMELDLKMLSNLQKKLNIEEVPARDNIPDLPQILNDFGIN